MTLKPLIAATLMVVMAGAASAQSSMHYIDKPVKTLALITPEDVDASRLLPPPPADGSAQAMDELVELHRIAASVSPERMAQARWDDEHESPELLKPTLGRAFDLTVLPHTAALLALVQNDASVSASRAKTLFKRKRPWAVDPTIKTCDPGDKPLTSYPSGHATLGYALALTMAVVLPGRAQDLMARAADYGYSREVCGSHFASDTQASQALATAMVTALLSKPDFQAKLTAARLELARNGFGQ
jgi:acid phosphatase (class A)